MNAIQTSSTATIERARLDALFAHIESVKHARRKAEKSAFRRYTPVARVQNVSVDTSIRRSTRIADRKRVYEKNAEVSAAKRRAEKGRR